MSVLKKLKFKEWAVYSYSKEIWYWDCDKCNKNRKLNSIKEWPRCLAVCQDCLDLLNIKY